MSRPAPAELVRGRRRGGPPRVGAARGGAFEAAYGRPAGGGVGGAGAGQRDRRARRLQRRALPAVRAAATARTWRSPPRRRRPGQRSPARRSLDDSGQGRPRWEGRLADVAPGTRRRLGRVRRRRAVGAARGRAPGARVRRGGRRAGAARLRAVVVGRAGVRRRAWRWTTWPGSAWPVTTTGARPGSPRLRAGRERHRRRPDRGDGPGRVAALARRLGAAHRLPRLHRAAGAVRPGRRRAGPARHRHPGPPRARGRPVRLAPRGSASGPRRCSASAGCARSHATELDGRAGPDAATRSTTRRRRTRRPAGCGTW